MAGPIINRIARESLVRTLEALRRHVEAAPAPGTSGSRLETALQASGSRGFRIEGWSPEPGVALRRLRGRRERGGQAPEPGVSLWMQTVSAWIGDVAAFERRDHAIDHHPPDTRDNRVRIRDERAGFVPSDERAVGVVGAIGERLAGHRDARGSAAFAAPIPPGQTA